MHWMEEEARTQLTEELAQRGVSGEEREWWEVGCVEKREEKCQQQARETLSLLTERGRVERLLVGENRRPAL